MKTDTTHTLLSIIAVVIGLGTIPSLGQDSGRGLFNLNRSKSDFQAAQAISNNLNQNVYTLDTLADQMVFRYGWDIRSKKDDQSAQALHLQMKRHAALTNDLIKANRSKNAKTFEKAARDVRDSVNRLQFLRKKTEVSSAVGKMIDQSLPIAAFIYSNARAAARTPLA